MGLQHTVQVGGAGEDNRVVILLNVNAVELGEEAKVLKGWLVFRWELETLAKAGVKLLGKGLVGASKGKIIHLAKEEDTFTVNDSRVDGSVMGGIAEAKLFGFQDAVDVILP